MTVPPGRRGELFYEEETITPVRDSSGTVTHFVSTARDITERERMKRSLTSRQNALQSVYQLSTTTGVSFEEVCDRVASTLSRLLGFSHVIVQEVIGGNVKMIAAIADGTLTHDGECFRESPFPDVQSAQEECQTLRDVRKWYPETGYFVEHDIKTYLPVPIKNKSGAVVGRIIAMDHEEQTVNPDNIQLVEIFGGYIAYEIERKAMEAQIKHQLEMQLLWQVASGLAHEIRNPLNAIQSITDAVCQDLRDRPEYRQHLSHIRSQVTRISLLMQELLDLGKQLSARNMQRISLASVCEEAINLWRQYAGHFKQSVQLIRLADDARLEVVADTGKLQQVLINLLENAAQHSPGESEIHLIVEPGETTVRARVTDQGSGIPAKDLEQVFEPFFTTRPGGTGLGLTVVKRIVGLHGGAIKITNNGPLPGCTVQVDLPSAPEVVGKGHPAAEEGQKEIRNS